ncbi:FMN reductase [Nocardioides sambongensis]|uniref:FMN reductase n=1 Tax=Nocardioides sambongensis TaxID=2589074 RepID=UPI00112A4BBA|nr:FMN reductase [Nocardioides sambongensis]
MTALPYDAGDRTSRRIVVVSAGLSTPSSTRLLADRLGAAAAEALGARGAEVVVQHVELRPLAHALADHLLTGFPDATLGAALDQVRGADGLVVVTPVFAASYSGLFKTFFDVLENGALDEKPVLIAATAGSARHQLALDHALRPLFAYLHAVVVPTGVFAASEDFGSAELEKRIGRAAGELAALVDPAHLPRTRQSGEGGAREGDRRVAADRFADPTPFEELLRRASGS